MPPRSSVAIAAGGVLSLAALLTAVRPLIPTFARRSHQ
jgi:hypothetical protein